MPTQLLAARLAVTNLAGGDTTSVPHGLKSGGRGVTPTLIVCDRSSPVAVTGYDTLVVTFTNVSDVMASANFRVEYDHSIHAIGTPTVAWQGWNGEAVPSGPAGGDLSGTYPNPLVVQIQGVPIQNGVGPANGDSLLYNSTLNQWQHAPITFSGGPPTGPASGDLGGIYPNPQVTGLQNDPLAATVADGFIKRNAVNTGWEEVAYGSAANTVTEGNDARLSDARVPTGPAGADLSGTYPDPTVVGLNTYPLDLTAPAAGDYLRFDGTTWRHTLVTPGSPVAIHGCFSDSTDQNIIPNTAQIVLFNTTETANGVSLVAGSRLTVAESGVYAVNISAQLLHTGGTTRLIKFWLRVDGVDVPDSTSSLEMGNNNNRVVPFFELVTPLNAGQYIQWVFNANGNSTSLQHDDPILSPPAAFAVPGNPSVIASVKRIGSLP